MTPMSRANKKNYIMIHKYRVWSNNQMYYLASSQISSIHLRMNNKFWSLYRGEKRICGNCDNSGELMQFTGKIDIKGVDIYQGDKVIDGTLGDFIVDYDKNNCSFFLSHSSGVDSCEMMEYDDGVLEVYGNIHEFTNN